MKVGDRTTLHSKCAVTEKTDSHTFIKPPFANAVALHDDVYSACLSIRLSVIFALSNRDISGDFE